jgi:hypothetical protein
VPGRRRAQPAPGWVPASTESMMLRSGDVVGTLCTVRTSDGPGDRSRVCRRTPERGPCPGLARGSGRCTATGNDIGQRVQLQRALVRHHRTRIPRRNPRRELDGFAGLDDPVGA